MNLKTVKNLSEAKLDGVKITWVKTDSSLKEVTFTDAAGNSVVVTGSYGITMLVPKPHEEADRYFLVGKFMDMVDVREVFETQYDADAKKSEYQDKAGYGVESGLRVEKAKVKVDDTGAVASEMDIPF